MKTRLLPLFFVLGTLITVIFLACTHEPPTGTISEVCSGVTITVNETHSNPTSTNPSGGSIMATASGGTGPYIYTLSGTATASNSTGSFTGLGAGTYTITAASSAGCTGTTTVVLSVSNPCTGVTITVNETHTEPTSTNPTGGTITANASGGTGPYTYALSGTSTGSNTTGSFTGLGSGNYVVTATSATGCTGTSNSITLAASNPCTALTVSGTSTHTSTICATDGTITATASGGTAPYQYSKNGTTFLATGSFTALSTGTLTITAKDANGCTGTTTITVSGPATVSFATDIKPTITQYCGRSSSYTSCHSHSNSWTTYSDVVGSSSGSNWSSNLSTFLSYIRGTTGSSNTPCPLTTSSGAHNMPKSPYNNTTWTNFVKGALTNWIDQGYPNN